MDNEQVRVQTVNIRDDIKMLVKWRCVKNGESIIDFVSDTLLKEISRDKALMLNYEEFKKLNDDN